MEERKDGYERVSFETDDGIEEFYILEQTTLGGVNYLLVTDDVESEDGDFLILKELKDKEEDFMYYEIVDDDKELKAVVPIFSELVDDFDLEV